MRAGWRDLFRKTDATRAHAAAAGIADVRARAAAFERLDDDALRERGRVAGSAPDVIALTTVVASRVLKLDMFDTQIQGALGLAAGHIVEMPTGEGKTLAAVPAAAWFAKGGEGVHVLTSNDYLAGRDADWMREVYRWMGLSVAAVHRDMSPSDRHAAYRADITYATANEVGFDLLRDSLAVRPDEQVHRDLANVIIDEADSILIDEARIPLVIAGGAFDGEALAVQADRTVRELLNGHHFTVDADGRHVVLTAAGVTRVERAMGCDNLFDPASLAAHTAIQDALHAHALLRRNVDYVVDDNSVLSVDEFKGRIVRERRWPAGLQTALECKERVTRRIQGRVLGSITVENLVGLYRRVAGMTGTAATQAEEFKDVYGLAVEIVPPHRPIVRDDRPDRIFETKAEKELAIVAEIRERHRQAQPVLVGTASVEESERMSRALADVPHQVLNARHEADEAAIIARAGERGAVTISTNMAGRGVDIRLGEGVDALGGLHVIGTNRHESRRIDNQLRGRAGRQGDPGSSQFFVSREDPLAMRFAGGDAGMPFDQMQRVAEGQNLDGRIFLRKYESIVEGQRQKIAGRRQTVLVGTMPETTRLVTLSVIDDLWADFLAAVAELRAGTTWVSLGYGKPLTIYLRQVDGMFKQMESMVDGDVLDRLAAQIGDAALPRQRGATWTYLTSDEPFGPMSERIAKQVVKLARRRFR